jgi:hypothetical protein
MSKAYFSVVVKTPRIEAIRIKWSKSEKEGRTHGGLDDILSTSRAPWNSSRVALANDGDELAVDDELAVLASMVPLNRTCTESYLNR